MVRYVLFSLVATLTLSRSFKRSCKPSKATMTYPLELLVVVTGVRDIVSFAIAVMSD